ncbi:hypothetical protein KBA01_29090 [Kozakia baliensis]|nr:hypothetical protein KBA01_29090 [Kozakia baliensis]
MRRVEQDFQFVGCAAAFDDMEMQQWHDVLLMTEMTEPNWMLSETVKTVGPCHLNEWAAKNFQS